MASATLALLHLAPRPGEVERNRRGIETAAGRAAALGATVVVTPELAVSGYGFRDRVGTGWIADGQAARFAWAGDLARRASISLLLGTPEAADGGALFNSLVLFAPDGTRVGQHRKINVLRVGSESWSSPGDRTTCLAVAGLGRVGLFVCADMYSQRLVQETVSPGVDLLLSSAAWAPGEHGPNGEWEEASRASGRPVVVCNRTGVDVLDFSAARSVAAVDGVLVHAHESRGPAIVLVDWTPHACTPHSGALNNWRVVDIEES